MRYIKVNKEVSIEEIRRKNYSFSSAQYKNIQIRNRNFLYVRDFLSRNLKNTDRGVEIGSVNYIDKSYVFFLRNKGLQEHSYIPVINEESLIPINPKLFKHMNLKEGDLIISKDSNIGEVVILDEDHPDWLLSGGLYKLPIEKNKYYLFAFLKHDICREQLDFMVPKSATIRHAKTTFLDCKIPLPNSKQDEIISYLEVLVKSVIKKESVIKEKELSIMRLIENELFTNSKTIKISPITISKVRANNRIDAGYYCEEFLHNQETIKNYSGGYKTIFDWGYSISRGQNLQVTAIGKSIYSNNEYENFYKLIRPLNLSDYGTANSYEFLGSSKKLRTLNEGDILFSAEGSIGKCMMVTNAKEHDITNIHGIILNKQDHNKLESGFIASFLRYLRRKRILDYISVGGQGGSLAMQYWNNILIPNFPYSIMEEISSLYHNPKEIVMPDDISQINFLENDLLFIQDAGIIELDRSIKKLKRKIDRIIDSIVMDENIEITYIDIF